MREQTKRAKTMRPPEAEAIAKRAYEMWQQRGCPLWESEADWFAARAELEQEPQKSGDGPSQSVPSHSA